MAKQRMTRAEVAEKLGSKLEQFVIWKDDGCWFWKGALNWDGYGIYGGGSAHRLVWIYFRGAIPEGLDLDHLCRVRRCVNPEHLEPVTRRENVHRIPAPLRSRKKEFCKRGHRMAEPNLIVRKDGHRECRICVLTARAKHIPLKGRGAFERAKTACPKGHPYTGHNLLLEKNGYRKCRVCKNDRQRAARARRKPC